MRSLRFVTAMAALAALAACSTDGGDVVTPTAVEDRVAPVRAAAAKGVDGAYIVVLHSGADARSVAAVAGVSPKFVYTAALDGFAATLNEGQLNALRHNPNVAYIEQDAIASMKTTQSPATWGLDRIDQRSLPLGGSYIYTPTGAGVRAYIVDTGILTSHTNFGGRATVGYDAVGDGRNGQDCEGHGTHVAGTVGSTTYGVAKSVSLIAVRVLDCTGNGSYSWIIAGLDWVAANHVKPAVVNMSLGGPANTAFDDAVRRVHNAGVAVVVAAGNENEDACTESPSRILGEAIVVGATTSTDARASFSDYGSCVDLFAPGNSITSLGISSTTSTAVNSGTSMASPHAAGVAALYLQGAPTATPTQVHTAIIGSATLGKLTGLVGSGTPNKLLFSGLTPDTGTPPTGAPCTTCTKYSGSLSGTGAVQYQPNNGTGYYYSSVSRTHQGWLRGPTSGADFDLYLQKWNGSSWVNVAAGESATSSENVSYSGTAGYYRWRVLSYSGSGAYDLWINPT
jgi:subtilisin family serine protease